MFTFCRTVTLQTPPPPPTTPPPSSPPQSTTDLTSSKDNPAARDDRLPPIAKDESGQDLWGKTDTDVDSLRFLVKDKATGETFWAIKDGICNTWCRWLTRESLMDSWQHILYDHNYAVGDRTQEEWTALMEDDVVKYVLHTYDRMLKTK